MTSDAIKFELQPPGIAWLKAFHKSCTFSHASGSITFSIARAAEWQLLARCIWLDGSEWTFHYRAVYHGGEADAWRNGEQMATRRLIDGRSGGAVLVWESATDDGVNALHVSTSARSISYRGGRPDAEAWFSYRWWWQPTPLEIPRSLAPMAALICGDIVSHLTAPIPVGDSA